MFVSLQYKYHNKYIYSMKHTANVNGQVILAAKCPRHGNFKIPLIDHMNGKGCPECLRVGPMDEAEFLKLLRRKHGRTYKYYLAKEFDPHADVLMKCKHHGEFQLNIWQHLHGRGCKECAFGIRSADQYTKEANRKHKGKYTYPDLEGNVNGDITVECPVHGKFKMHHQAHLGGSGCRNCTFKYKWFHIYCFVITPPRSRKFYKIGLTDDVARREKELRRKLKDGFTIELLTSYRYKQEHGAFTTEYYFLSNVPGEMVSKTIVGDGSTETKDNGFTPQAMLDMMDKLDRKYRRTHNDYVPERQSFSASMTGKARFKKRRR